MPRRDLIRNGDTMKTVPIILAVLALVTLALSVRVVKQYELGVLFRFGRLLGTRPPGLRIVIPVAEVLHRVSLRIVTMPIQSQASSPATTSAWTCQPSPTSGLWMQ